MTTVEILRAARALIDTPEKWTKGVMRDGNRRCAVGAVCDAAGGEMHLRFAELEPVYTALRCAGGRRIHLLNDHSDTTHADVLGAFDRAIAAEEAKA